MVKFRDGASAATIGAAHKEAGGAQTMKSFSFGAHRWHHLKLVKGVTVEDAIAKYRQHAAVEYAEPNYVFPLAGIPNDPLFTQLWALHNTGQTVSGITGTAGADIHALEAWDITTGSPNVIIAVVDAGIAYDHPDLASNMWTNPGETPNDGIDNDGNGFVDDYYGYDFINDDGDPMEVMESHGTGLSGTIAAVGNNSLGVTGVMHTAKLMALKAGTFVAGQSGVTTATLIPAGNYAISKGARVINASFGRLGGPCSAAEYSILSALNAAGVIVVAAAGNQTTDTDTVPFYPAHYSVATACGPALPNVIAVAATDMSDNLASFSNFGAASVQIAAPGFGTIYSTSPTSNVRNILLHNFDANPGVLGYTFSGSNNSWGFTNSASFSPPNSLTDSPAGNYLNNTDSFATGPVFSTVGQRGCLLTGALRLALGNDSDGILIQTSGDGGLTWKGGNIFSSATGGAFLQFPLWEVRDHNPINQFRINFVSDASGTGDGAYLDDLRVDCVSGAPSGDTDYYGGFGGTSFATAHVTGVVGLLMAAYPSLTVAQVRDAIVNTGDVLPSLAGKTLTGRRLNARAALDSRAPFTVTVQKAGTGTGLVTSSPTGITCGSTCNFQFGSGTTLTLTATPAAGSVFSGWNGGGCTGTGACTLSTTAAVTATFVTAPAPFTVTVTKNGTGTGTVTSSPRGVNSGINCGASCTDQFDQGTTVTLTATPAAGSVFSGWSGGNCVGTGICQLTVDAMVTATFTVATPAPFTVTVTKNGTGTGTVTSSPRGVNSGINCGASCTDQFDQGTTVTLTATPAAGSVFSGWNGGNCVGTGICQLTVDATVAATFSPAPPPGTFTLVIARVGTGSGTVISSPAGVDCGGICSGFFLDGTAVTLTATSNPGSTFAGWSGGGCTGVGTCITDTAATVKATFDSLTPSSSSGDTAQGSSGGCTIAQAGTNDVLIPALLLMTIGAVIWRVRRRSH
jgi:subtilisin family serine protease